MRLVCLFILALLALSGCRGGGGDRTGTNVPARDPAATAVPATATGRAVIWDLEYLAALCPECRQTLEYRSNSCTRCKTPCAWGDPEIPNTPEGAFTALKLAALYDDVGFYRLALVRQDAERMEHNIRMGGPTPLGSRELAVETRVKSTVPGVDSALLVIEYRGRFTQMESRVEDGRWKISLAQTENAARVSMAKQIVQGLKFAIERYAIERETFPPTGNFPLVTALSQPAANNQPYYWFTQTSLNQQGLLVDPWGHPFQYTFPVPAGTIVTPPAAGEAAPAYLLYSIGPNGVDEQGAGDDIQ